MTIEAYVNFNGDCRESVDFYADVFGIEKPQIMTFGEMPANPEFPISEEVKDLVMHTNLTITGSRIMFSDVPPGMPFVQGNNISLTVISGNKEYLTNAFEKLREGGKVEMELQETFWSKCYGYLIDKFGIGWQLSYDEGKTEV